MKLQATEYIQIGYEEFSYIPLERSRVCSSLFDTSGFP